MNEQDRNRNDTDAGRMTIRRAEPRDIPQIDVLLHQVHLLVNVPQLVIVKVDYISRIGFRPADQHRIGVFE